MSEGMYFPQGDDERDDPDDKPGRGTSLADQAHAEEVMELVERIKRDEQAACEAQARRQDGATRTPDGRYARQGEPHKPRQQPKKAQGGRPPATPRRRRRQPP
jgi:hypothetical protein